MRKAHNKMTPEQFIDRAKEAHSGKYDYSLTNYQGSYNPVTITCPIHGNFIIKSARQHLRGNGCFECAHDIHRDNLEGFIVKAQRAHGTKYDYSKVVYETTAKKVTVICPKHGEFDVRAGSHTRGQGCPKCYLDGHGDSQEAFIDKVKAIHGDRYDLSLVDYRRSQDRVAIICRRHGPFEKRARDIVAGGGCSKCAIEAISDTTESFIEKARTVHGNRYDYSRVDHRGANRRVIIICPIHGEWLQTPGSHIDGHGCPECSYIESADKRRDSLDEFIQKATQIHQGKYTYDKVVYRGVKNKITITCLQHGDFDQTAGNHIANHGCPVCKRELLSEIQRTSTAEFIQKAIDIHGTLYDYSKAQYGSNQKEPITIICPDHGEFQQVPNYHLSGNGCPFCYRSRGEMKIAGCLDEWGIRYEQEVKFSSCKNKRPLPFDFQIFTGESSFLLEYHGQHHYKPIKRFGGENKLKIRQHHDAIKEEWAKSRGVRLVIVPYWEFGNIKAILEREINKTSMG